MLFHADLTLMYRYFIGLSGYWRTRDSRWPVRVFVQRGHAGIRAPARVVSFRPALWTDRGWLSCPRCDCRRGSVRLTFDVWKLQLGKDCEREDKLIAFNALSDSVLLLLWQSGYSFRWLLMPRGSPFGNGFTALQNTFHWHGCEGREPDRHRDRRIPVCSWRTWWQESLGRRRGRNRCRRASGQRLDLALGRIGGSIRSHSSPTIRAERASCRKAITNVGTEFLRAHCRN